MKTLWPIGLSLLVATTAFAQNPMNSVNEPDMAPGGQLSGWVFFWIIAGYVFVFWLVLAGPLKHWADDHKGWAYLILWGGPAAIALLATRL